MVRSEFEDKFEDRGTWSLATSKIMPSLEDLHFAIRRRDLRKVKLLCSHSTININSIYRSMTALSLAVQESDKEIVIVLLEKGADINKLSRDANDRLEPPLFTACRKANYELAHTLVEFGANVNTTDYYMHTPLWIATRERSLELVKLLVNSGANMNAGDKHSQCPLYLATKYLGREEIAKLLIRHGCRLDSTDVDGRGAIHWSLANNAIDVFKLLIYAGAHVNCKDRKYMTNNRNMPQNLRQNDDLMGWIKAELSNPPLLTRLVSQSIRHHLTANSAGRSIWPSIKLLPIPEKLKHELMLADVQQEGYDS